MDYLKVIKNKYLIAEDDISDLKIYEIINQFSGKEQFIQVSMVYVSGLQDTIM